MVREYIIEVRDGNDPVTVGELVRCKDCKHNVGSSCDYSAVYTRPHGYCDWGKRKETEDAVH